MHLSYLNICHPKRHLSWFTSFCSLVYVLAGHILNGGTLFYCSVAIFCVGFPALRISCHTTAKMQNGMTETSLDIPDLLKLTRESSFSQDNCMFLVYSVFNPFYS
ncbi:hypothetical protein CLF_104923 [Clonorchis sinensis]|uniref:Uncharacterized protein n=1 Tax=Clonorchis sinensis TaxID=79923 RepID=G7YCL4_CLOSI|nr:hypothetical protein CLF_104923 [Clonorchis sinensis]